MTKVKKNSYLLLELLIAFFLLSLFLAPMLSSPFAYVRRQMKEVTSIHLQLEEERLLALIEEKLRTGEISWDTLMESADSPVLLETLPLNKAKGIKPHEAQLFLSNGRFQTQEGLCFGTVKAGAKIYPPASKKTAKKPTSLSLFVLKKQMSPPHDHN